MLRAHPSHDSWFDYQHGARKQQNKITVFWDMKSCRLVDWHLTFWMNLQPSTSEYKCAWMRFCPADRKLKFHLRGMNSHRGNCYWVWRSRVGPAVFAVLMQTEIVHSLRPYQDPALLRRFKDDFRICYQHLNKRLPKGSRHTMWATPHEDSSLESLLLLNDLQLKWYVHIWFCCQ